MRKGPKSIFGYIWFDSNRKNDNKVEEKNHAQ